MSSLPKRLLIVCPSWLGDVVMATPAFRRLRAGLPGAFIGALLRPGLDDLLAGSDYFDEVHVDRAQGVMGPKLVASRLRPRRYDAAVLLTNSFSTALITRLAFIPRRIGYDRDGRGVLLTERLKALKRADGRWACVPAVDYYLSLADAVLEESGGGGGRVLPPPAAQPRGVAGGSRLELATTTAQEREADRILSEAGITAADRFAVINPGANNEAKRWPAERFGELAAWLHASYGLRVLVNGSPAERELVDRVVAADSPSRREGAEEPAIGRVAIARPQGTAVSLTGLGVTIGSLKAIIRRAALMVTNDTGPRHMAAAFGIPTVTLFGPTDPRWTTLPPDDGRAPRIDLVADPTLPPSEIADDHPDRCRIDRIAIQSVMDAVETALGRRQSRPEGA